MKNYLLGVILIILGLSYFWLKGGTDAPAEAEVPASFLQKNDISPPKRGISKNEQNILPASQIRRLKGKKEAGTFLPVLRSLPTIEEGRRWASAGDAHQMPAELIDKIAPLVKIKRIVKENPNLEPAALEFYERCAAETHLMNAVRARCLTHLRSLAKKRGETVDLSQYSAHLIRLSEFINL